ncbi:MAG: AbrB/MazE/SpoVT family DNA-binding domain-containing protein [Candidatus Bathyarchaeia archaeon]
MIKRIDERGRIVIPKEWRDILLKDRRVIMKLKKKSIEVMPATEPDLTKYFDSVVVDLKSDLSDWHSVRSELIKGTG